MKSHIEKINVLKLSNEKFLSIIGELSLANMFLMNKVNKLTEAVDVMKTLLFFLSMLFIALTQG